MANLPASKIPAKALLQGYEVEKEHTTNPTERLIIGVDHTGKEGTDYYDKLKIMENTPLSKLQTLRKCMAAGNSLNKSSDKGNVNIGGQDYEYEHDPGVKMVSYYHTGDGMNHHAHVSHSKSGFANQNTFTGHPASHKQEFQNHADQIIKPISKTEYSSSL
jgi:hypothetical protein